MSIPNVGKRIAFLVAAVLSYVFLPVFLLITVPLFPVGGHMVSALVVTAIRDSVVMILVYGALAWVAPSLVPPYITRKAVTAIMCGIVIITTVSGGMYMLGPSGI